jgi:hypothetical protein
MVVELDRGTRLVGAALVMPKIDEAFPTGSSIRAAALHKLIGAIWFSGEMRSHHGHDLGALRKRGGQEQQHGGHMRNIVNEDGEIIAKATKDGTLVGGHHRIVVAGSLNQKLSWQDTGEPVKLDALMRLSSHRHIA